MAGVDSSYGGTGIRYLSMSSSKFEDRTGIRYLSMSSSKLEDRTGIRYLSMSSSKLEDRTGIRYDLGSVFCVFPLVWEM